MSRDLLVAVLQRVALMYTGRGNDANERLKPFQGLFLCNLRHEIQGKKN